MACPGCGFELSDQLNCEGCLLSPGAEVQTNPKCDDPENLLDQNESCKPVLIRGSRVNHTQESDYRTGIRQIDSSLMLRPGQLAVLQGKTANQIVFRLAARAISPQGGSQNIVFIDGGNSFDTYTLSKHFAILGLREQVKERVHLSRAFTYSQLAHLIREKLPNVLTNHSARMVCVSDITLLFSDPDVKDKAEAVGFFRSSIRFLVSLAGQSNVLIIVTNLESRDRRMDSILLEYARIFARVEDRGGSTWLTVKKNPFVTQPVSTGFDCCSMRLDQNFQ